MGVLPESVRPSTDGFLGDLLRSEPSRGGHDSHVLGRGSGLKTNRSAGGGGTVSGSRRRVPKLDLGGLQDGNHSRHGGLLRKTEGLDVENVQGLGGMGQTSVSEDEISGRAPLASSSSITPMQVYRMVCAENLILHILCSLVRQEMPGYLAAMMWCSNAFIRNVLI